MTNATWGVPCAWEVISQLDAACDTVYGGDLTFNWTYPDDSKNQAPNYYKEYEVRTLHPSPPLPSSLSLPPHSTCAHAAGNTHT